MDKVKASRKQYRRLFMIAYNEFNEIETELSIENKILKLKVLEEKAKLMLACEYEFRELLFASHEKEEEIDRAIDESEGYIDKWRFLENKLNNHIDEKKELSDGASTVSGARGITPNNFLHYPKINLPTFDGNIKNWLCFWGQFQKIDQDTNLDNHDKYSYLSQAMEKGSAADELIKSFPPGGENYEKAVKQLQIRYGREELLIEVYVRDLLSIVLLKQKVQKASLRKLYDQLETKLRALETLGVTKDKYAAMLYPLVESALPDETLKAWERCRTAHRRVKEESSGETSFLSKKTPTNDLDRLLDFLQDEVEGEERILIATQSFDQCKISSSFDNRRETNGRKFSSRISSATELLASSISEEKLCIFCSQGHNSWDCRKAPKLPLLEKQRAVENAHCCFLCLRNNHGVKNCRSKMNCQLCGKKHHLFLCRSLLQEHNFSSVHQSNEVREPVVQHDEALANLSTSSNVFLQTLTVIVRGKNMKRKARAIIDSGSQRSYILKTTAEEMKYGSKGKEYLQHALFGGSSTSTCQHDVFTIYLSNLTEDYSCHFEGLGQVVICNTILGGKQGPYLKELENHGICLAEDLGGPIEILIGADIAGKLITGNHLQLKSGLTAIETKLGWTVIGRPSSQTSGFLTTSMLSTSACISDVETLDSLGITDPSEKKATIELQEEAKQHFLDTVKIEDNTFTVNLPWIEGHIPLYDNFELSEKRFYRVVKRLKAEGLFESYEKVFKEWLEENINEEVPKSEVRLPANYLPHRPVLKENSTTKIRPVFDASKGTSSLNDCLESGVNLIELISNILYRFCLEKVGVITDIRKAFLQISLSPSDRDYQRVLWIAENGQLRHFQHCRIVFGVSRSPFLLGIVIPHHLQSVSDSEDFPYPENIIKLWTKSFYENNCITSMSNEQELRKQGSGDTEEFLATEKRIIKIIQTDAFSDEKDKWLKKLAAFKDEDGLIQLKAKIVNGKDIHYFTRPVILPSQHHVVRLLIFSFHQKHGHVGTQMLLNLLREHYWILNGIKTVRSIISKCVTLKRRTGKGLEAGTVPITKDHIRDAAAFEVVGVDLACTLYLKDQRNVWACLFTCAVFRSVHMELVSDLSTDSFFLVLPRIVARRDRCAVIYCENGSYFVGAANWLKTLDWDRIIETGTVNRIQWKFNPPTASWWERLIQVMKEVLKMVIGSACLSYEEMSTVLCDCEAVINSRPLTYIAEAVPPTVKTRSGRNVKGPERLDL